MKNEFLERLRAETETMHRALERNEYATRLLSHSVTVGDYADYLEKMLGFVLPFEQYVMPLTMQRMPDVKAKAALIANDLSGLGRQVGDITMFDAEKLVGTYNTEAKALGGLYVMEGSTLGGMVIHQHLHKNLGTAIEGKASYFTVHGKETGSRWKQFLETFCQYTQENNQEAEVIAGAVATFSMLNDWMHERHHTVVG